MNTVALIFKDGDKVIIPYEVAQEQYNRLNNLQLVHEKDMELFAALTAALGILPKIPLGLTEENITVAESLIRRWKKQFPELNQ